MTIEREECDRFLSPVGSTLRATRRQGGAVAMGRLLDSKGRPEWTGTMVRWWRRAIFDGENGGDAR
ncbi:MAG: hypothetical protein LC776_12315 [Acidobacteria bacterium]|nr:hypothetical protein [Acidobacteriota bacterium]